MGAGGRSMWRSDLGGLKGLIMLLLEAELNLSQGQQGPTEGFEQGWGDLVGFKL